MVRFEIPKSATRLEQVPPSDLDLRSDEEIIAQLKTYQPIISEKNVWAFWDKGIDYMYPSYQVTILNWVRKLGPSWTVRLLDLVEDSPNNVYTFIDKSFFPECFNNKTMDGRHIAQHQADFMRLPVLYLHGGVYMDVGNMLHTHLDPLFWDHISADDSPYEIAIWMICGQIKKAWGSFGNNMMAARKGCLFIKHWHEGYKELWRTQTNDVDSHKPLIMRDIGLADGIADWGMEDYVNEMSDYVAQMLIGDRTRNLVDVNTGWNGRDFFMNKAFMVEGIYNGILGAIRTEYNGYKQADLLTTRLDEPDLEKRQAAEDFVVELLEQSHMFKVYHNGVGDMTALGDLVKKEGYKDITHRPGTFGELYRFGTVHWRSTKGVERVVPEKIEDELIYATATTAASEHTKREI